MTAFYLVFLCVNTHSTICCCTLSARDSREPPDRRKEEQGDFRQEGNAAQDHRESSLERRRPRERSAERYRDRGERGRQERGPASEGGGHSAREDNTQGHHNRVRRDRGRDPRYPGHHTKPRESPSSTPSLERRPERLMRNQGEPSAKDLESYDKFPTRPAGTMSMSRRDRRDRDVPEELQEDKYSDRIQRQHLDPSSAANKTSRSRRKVESMLRNDSLSSDPSDCVRPPPPRPHKHKKGKKQRQASFSSSDDEIQTTPECTSCEEPEIESESVSEKGNQTP